MTEEKKDDDRISQACSDEELDDWIVTSVKVLSVLKDEDKEIYDKIYSDFTFDLQRLKKANRITDEDYEDILEDL